MAPLGDFGAFVVPVVPTSPPRKILGPITKYFESLAFASVAAAASSSSSSSTRDPDLVAGLIRTIVTASWPL
jgi:hypothetical protein